MTAKNPEREPPITQTSGPDAQTGAPHATRAQDRALALWEILSIFTSSLIAEWVVLSLGGGSNLLIAFTVGLAFLFMLCSHWARGERARDIGWRVDNLLHALRLLALPTLAAVVLLVAVGLYFSNVDFARWRGGRSLFGMPVLGLLWGLVQQYVLQGFVNRRAQLIWGRGAVSVLVVALMFAVLHFPNPALTLATFAGGLLWAFVYQRAPNLFALGLSHSLMTWVLISTVPASALNGLRVGFKFFG